LAVAEATQKSSGLAAFFSGLLNFGTQRSLGYASLVVVMAFAAIFAVVKLRSTPEPVAVKKPEPEKAVAAIPSSTNSNPTTDATESTETVTQPKSTPAGIKVRYQRPQSTVASAPKPAPVKLLPGERSYLQAIARLDSTIKSNQKAMRPSLEVEYQRNLAVVDRAIAATRSAAKSNPNDPDAADFMFAAYQSKVDLLNTIADARLGGGRGH
jgi:hypothetical protein